MKYMHAIKQALEELIVEKGAYILGEDVMDPYGGAFKVTKGLSDKYPNHVKGVPMCEQGFTAVCVGMALMGNYVLEEIMFGDFITLTADQMINHAAKFYDLYGQKLHLVIRTPSGGYRGYGATHSQSLEKMFLGIPGMRVVAPNIFMDVCAFLKEVIEEGKPTLFVENKLDYPKELILDDFDIFSREERKRVVRLSVKGEEPEITIVTYGGMSMKATDAAKQLMYEEEIAVDVVIISELSETIHLSREAALEEMVKTEKVLIVEESTGGFGFAAQTAYEFMKFGKKVKILHGTDHIIPSAKKAEEEVLVQTEDIVNEVKALYEAG